MLHLRTQNLTETLRADVTPDVVPAWNRNRTMRRKKKENVTQPKSPIPSPGDGRGQTPGRRRRRAEILDAAGSSAVVGRRRRLRAELLDGNRRLRRKLLYGKAASGVSAASCWTEGGGVRCVGPQAVSRDFLNRRRRPR
jgi:hypothetical protein